MKKVGLIKIVFLFFIVVLFVVINIIINHRNSKIYGDYNGSNELLSTINCSEIFNNSLNSSFLISFDLRTDKQGKVKIYLYDSEGERYWFEGKVVDSTTEFEHYEIVCCPKMIDSSKEEAHLFFDGEYGSGIIAHVKNIVISPINE